MVNQIKEIAERLAELRDVCDISTAEMAKKLGISEDEYLSYEKGEKDFSISFICNAAAIFGVESLDIMTGETPKLSVCTVVKKGQGFSVNRVNRDSEYDYKHLAYTFKNKKAEPFLVTLDPSLAVPVMHEHEGQEFNYVLSGDMVLYIGDISYEVSKGDSMYFDSSVPHAQKAVGDKPAKFLAMVIK